MGKFLTRLNPETASLKQAARLTIFVANHSTLQEDLYLIYEGRPDTGHPIIKRLLIR